MTNRTPTHPSTNPTQNDGSAVCSPLGQWGPSMKSHILQQRVYIQSLTTIREASMHDRSVTTPLVLMAGALIGIVVLIVTVLPR